VVGYSPWTLIYVYLFVQLEYVCKREVGKTRAAALDALSASVKRAAQDSFSPSPSPSPLLFDQQSAHHQSYGSDDLLSAERRILACLPLLRKLDARRFDCQNC
jgi:hypothetical protein